MPGSLRLASVILKMGQYLSSEDQTQSDSEEEDFESDSDSSLAETFDNPMVRSVSRAGTMLVTNKQTSKLWTSLRLKTAPLNQIQQLRDAAHIIVAAAQEEQDDSRSGRSLRPGGFRFFFNFY